MDKELMLNKYGSVIEGREDIILVGSLILLEIMKIWGLEKVTVSSKGLRYGVLVDYLTRFHQKNNKRLK